MHTEIRRRIIYVAVLLIAIGGTARCTSYGGGGSEEALFEQIAIANELFAQDLERARSGVNRLQEVSTMDPSVAAHAARYQAILQGHEAMLAVHRKQQERTGAGDGHRELSRTFGSILAGQQVVRDRYSAFWRLDVNQDSLREGASGRADSLSRGEDWFLLAAVSDSRYAFTPPFYRRVDAGLEQFGLFGSSRMGRSESALEVRD